MAKSTTNKRITNTPSPEVGEVREMRIDAAHRLGDAPATEPTVANEDFATPHTPWKVLSTRPSQPWFRHGTNTKARLSKLLHQFWNQLLSHKHQAHLIIPNLVQQNYKHGVPRGRSCNSWQCY